MQIIRRALRRAMPKLWAWMDATETRVMLRDGSMFSLACSSVCWAVGWALRWLFEHCCNL